MKKIAIATVIALAATAASALEVGVTAGQNFARGGSDCGAIIGPRTCNASDDRNEYGITVGHKYGRLGVVLGLSQAKGGSPVAVDSDGPLPSLRQDRLGLTGTYDVVKFGLTTVHGSLGVAHLWNQSVPAARSLPTSSNLRNNGYVMTAGVGASFPVTKQVSMTADYTRQYGQDRVSQFDGDRVTLGLKYRF